MTTDDVLQAAREAGLYLDGTNTKVPLYVLKQEELTRFAELIAAREREACAKVCEVLSSEYHAHAMDCATAIRARGNV